MKKRIFSGVRPTGNIHLGNYLGAMKNWHSHDEKLLCIVDLHALTTVEDSHRLQDNIYHVAAAYVACGFEKEYIFVQGDVPFHTELTWYLACHTPMGWLNRMTQFKDKAKNKDKACLGLYAYPVLMAADILAYDTTHVPVGADQKQHVELARDIALSLNHHYQKDVFTVPVPVVSEKSTARVMSLRDGTKKMSKSDPSDYSRIHLLDTQDEIALKIRKAKTDPLPITQEGLDARPEAKNLLGLYAALAEVSLVDTITHFEGENFSTFKEKLTELLVEVLSPLRREMSRLLDERSYLDTLLARGRDYATALACGTKERVRHVLYT